MARPSFLTSATSLLALCRVGLAANGPAASTGPVDDGNFVREAWSTLIVPDAPNPVNGNTVLWVGIGTSTDLIQGINDNYPPNYGKDVCSDLGNRWCVAAYTIAAGSGPHATSGQGDQVTMHYTYNDSTGNYDQAVSINNTVVSTISHDSGLGLGFGTALECTTAACGYVPPHFWTDTTIILETSYPGYINTFGNAAGVTDDMSTSDGGKTWTITTIDIPGYTFTTD